MNAPLEDNTTAERMVETLTKSPDWSRRVLLRWATAAVGAILSAPFGRSAGAETAPWPAKKPPGWDALVAAANKEGKLVIYGPPTDEVHRALVTRFQAVFPGIKVEATAVGVQGLTRVLAERSAHRYIPDLFINGTSSALIGMKPIGALVPLEPLLVLPEILDPKLWAQDMMWWADEKKPYTTLVFQGLLIPPVYVNTSIINVSQFKSYWDLCDPKWKGKVCSNDIRFPGPGGEPARFIYSTPSLGRPWFEKFFGTLDVRMSRDQRQLVDWCIQGQYPIVGFVSTDDAQVAIKQGLPLGAVRLDQLKEGGAIAPGSGGLCVLNNTPHPNAAKLYVNWLLSRAGQTAWQEETKLPSLREDVPTNDIAPVHRRKPGFIYANGGQERYSHLTSSIFDEMITTILKKAGRG